MQNYTHLGTVVSPDASSLLLLCGFSLPVLHVCHGVISILSCIHDCTTAAQVPMGSTSPSPPGPPWAPLLGLLLLWGYPWAAASSSLILCCTMSSSMAACCHIYFLMGIFFFHTGETEVFPCFSGGCCEECVVWNHGK